MSADETHLMQPLEQAIKRAGLLLANIQASRWEAIPSRTREGDSRGGAFYHSDGDVIRVFSATSSQPRSFSHTNRPAWIRTRVPEPYELENTLTKVLGGLASHGVRD